ncbi:MAG: GerMN domain-containing protein [bacterium]
MRFSLGDPSEGGRGRETTHAPRARVLLLALTTGLLVLVLVAVTVTAAGCGVGGDVGDAGTVSTTEGTQTTVTTLPEVTTTTVPSQTTTTVGADTMTVTVYYSRDEKMSAAARTLPKAQEVGAAAMKALLEGPSAEERTAGMFSAIPDGTTFLGLSIKDGVATVDLSREYASGGGSLSMAMRLAEVVFTLTQFPTVDGVNFKLDGKPVDVFGGEGIILDHPVNRTDYEELSPAILVESPTLGDAVGSPLRVVGTANVFEAVFRINIVNWDGLIIADEVVTATSGTGTRGTFDVTIPFTVDRAGLGALIVFAQSPKDGSQIDVVEIPLQLEK